MKRAVGIGLVSVLCFSISGCVAQQPLVKQTASGYPEGIFTNTNRESVRSKIIDGCSSRGLLVSESTPDYVVCTKNLTGKDAFAASLAIGSSYSTSPQRRVRFTIYQNGPDVKVTVQQWVECQSAYGQNRTMELNNNNQRNDVQNFLSSLGAE